LEDLNCRKEQRRKGGQDSDLNSRGRSVEYNPTRFRGAILEVFKKTPSEITTRGA